MTILSKPKTARNEAFSDECLFEGVVTIHPQRALEAWDRLTADTTAEEIGLLPDILHNALLATAQERLKDPGTRKAIIHSLLQEASKSQ